jgi:hypothetical protein
VQKAAEAPEPALETAVLVREVLLISATSGRLSPKVSSDSLTRGEAFFLVLSDSRVACMRRNVNGFAYHDKLDDQLMELRILYSVLKFMQIGRGLVSNRDKVNQLFQLYR